METLIRCDDDISILATDGNNLLSGDDKGIVTTYANGRIKMRYNLVEEVRGMACQNNTLFTVCDKDVTVCFIKDKITDAMNGMCFTKEVFPGAAPICLFGLNSNGEKQYVVFPTRSGKGLVLIKFENLKMVWTIEGAHEMIINTICGTNEALYTAGWDGIVKKWTSIETKPKLSGEVNVSCCVNTMCCPPDGESVIVGGADGIVKKLTF